MLRRAIGYGLLGVTAYVGQGAINDAIMYTKCKSIVHQHAAGHKTFITLLGGSTFDGDCRLGPWYDSSVSLLNGGMVAAVTLPARGPLRSSDVTTRVSI